MLPMMRSLPRSGTDPHVPDVSPEIHRFPIQVAGWRANCICDSDLRRISRIIFFISLVTWDDGLAVLARAWARNCLFEHNPQRNHPVFPSVGENIWAGTPGTRVQVKSMIKSWVNEVQHYNYYTLACTNVCGHYTQVWATTYKVGCAVIFCPDGVRQKSFSHRPGALFVCNYATAQVELK
ncbi:glioma pathogenesis-related protein 1-like [Tachysurus vachellii]|uniref:glioma pathogenesis-related protein 1-like n=1 Tax=Tachysurus vachellii TaxID=175792 RepID=UPI00296B33A5|nr:glioma pathogenesis-related protein 1-like [Tachysurus vachellii]